jgi:phosphoribosyl 1,2-cyclic phosphodiesterase
LTAEDVWEKVRHALEIARDKKIDAGTDIDAFMEEELPFWAKATYGTNTPCLEIRDAEKFLLCDAGTGLRDFGNEYLRTYGPNSSGDFHIFLTHFHWDHIQGFPFFMPIYQSNRKIYMFPTPQAKTMLCSLIDQMDGAHFPVSPENLNSQYICVTSDPLDFLHVHGFNISRIATNHPGSGYAYRILEGSKSVVYMTDNELKSSDHKVNDFSEFVRFCNQADVLIHDAQYIEEDMPFKHGWGHSLVSEACELAAASAVKHLILFHHDPDRSDKDLDLIQEKARSWFQDKNLNTRCTVAYEGLTLDI